MMYKCDTVIICVGDQYFIKINIIATCKQLLHRNPYIKTASYVASYYPTKIILR